MSFSGMKLRKKLEADLLEWPIKRSLTGTRWLSSVCEVSGHTLAACLAINRLKDFLRWLVSTKRNSGGINLSAAVAYGMPKGRGRKGERAPRKRSV